MWGRNVYDSIRKFLQFQLTVNVVAVILAFVGAVTDEHGESPLKPVQLLWVNLIMDTMAALALATDPPTPDLLDRRPYAKNENPITKRMQVNIIGQAIFQLIVNGAVLYCGNWMFGIDDEKVHRTLIFNVFVMCQVFNEINCRKLGTEWNTLAGFFSNYICVAVLFFTLIMQYLIIEYGGEFASTTPLNQTQWLQCIGLGSLGIPVSFLLKTISVTEPAPPPVEFSEAPSKKDKGDHSREAPEKPGWDRVKQVTLANSVVNAFQAARRTRIAGTEGFSTKKN